MNCPHCGGDLELAVCPHCGAETLATGKFCCQCGSGLQIEPPPDLTDRILCPDGACIGILNDREECSVCGLAYREVLAGEQSHG
jgi:hypothetical protein